MSPMTPAPDPTALRPRLLARLPGPLRALTGGLDDVEVLGSTVGEALDDLVRRHPSLRRHLRTETGALREHVNVFLGDRDVRSLGGLEAVAEEGQELVIVASIAGG